MLIDFKKLKIKGTSVRSLRLRELNSEDNDAASARVVNSGTPLSTNGFLLSKAISDQQLSDAITEVDGDPTVTPYFGWKKWNLRTKEFVIGAYNRLNAATMREMEDFFIGLGLEDANEKELDPGGSR